MFADDTNSFCSIKEIKPLFLKANLELGEISEWFQADKLSLNEGKTTVTLFHMPQDRDNLPVRLPALKINDYEIKRSSSTNFLSLINHINTLKNKLSNNLGLLYKAKPFLNVNAMSSLLLLLYSYTEI